MIKDPSNEWDDIVGRGVKYLNGKGQGDACCPVYIVLECLYLQFMEGEK